MLQKRNSAAGLVLLLIASLLTVLSPGRAVAAESIPELQWPAVASTNNSILAASPNGDVTDSCVEHNLRTYGPTGQLVRELDRNMSIDGVKNCILLPAFSRNGDLYGQQFDVAAPGSSSTGTNLLAYRGNILKWKYPRSCSTNASSAAVGADGNVYFINSDGHLIGVTQDVKPPLAQPAKVLDVPTEGSCYNGVQVFKDGLAVTRGGSAMYYTYGGQYLGKVLLARDYAINATGRAFSPTFVVSGGLRSLSISAYDPMTKTWAWKHVASSDGAYVSSAKLHPTPDGGVLALLEEKEVVGGVQTGKYVDTLVKLNDSGVKVWSKTLPKQQGSFSTQYAGARAQVDSNGNIAIVRDGFATVDGKTNRAILIEVRRPNGAVAYSRLMHNDLGDTTGLVAGDFVIGANTLYLRAKPCAIPYCTGEPMTKLYPIKIPGLGLDYPLNAVLVAPAAKPYVALGDSYSSGEGVPPFDADSDTSSNKCHRSVYAYSRLVSRDITLSASVGVGGLRACSGAKAKHITGKWVAGDSDEGVNLNESPQVSALSTKTRFVSLTIGGNDIGFSDFGNACFDNTCRIGSTAYNTAVGKIGTLSSKLETAYKAILAKAPNAKVYVLGYPQVAPIKSPGEANDIRCLYLSDSNNSWGDARAARDVVARLDSKIKSAVNTVANTRLHYVEVNGANSPFAGHTVCSAPGDSYFANIDQVANDRNYIFHPNYNGSVAYAKVLLAEMNR